MTEKGGRITDSLKVAVDGHEERLQSICQKLLHANTHIEALTDVADRLRFQLEVKKSMDEKKESQVTQEKEQEDGTSHFKFPPKCPSDQEFMNMVETLVEGILLVQRETRLGQLVQEVQGPAIREDLQKWRQVIAVLQKYDDQVRRAIEYYERQQSE